MTSTPSRPRLAPLPEAMSSRTTYRDPSSRAPPNANTWSTAAASAGAPSGRAWRRAPMIVPAMRLLVGDYAQLAGDGASS